MSKTYTAHELFENWDQSFSTYEMYVHENGKEDLKIIAANRNFARLIGADYDTLVGRLFTDACPMAMEWLAFYIQVAKTGKGHLHESYNQDLKKYLSAMVFSPRIGQICILVIDRTQIWQADQAQHKGNDAISALLSSMTTGFCIGKILRDSQGKAVDMLFQTVNASFEILEGFPTGELTGKRLFEVRKEVPHFKWYVDAVDLRKKTTFIKHVEWNDRMLEATCFSSNGDTLICIENDVTERVRASEELKQTYATIKEQNQTILASINYSSKIQQHILPDKKVFEKAFSDYSIIWKPRDIVGGDIYWAKNFEQGTVLVVCDCTGHGTPGALLTMLVASALDDCVGESNCSDTAGIVWNLDQKLVSIFSRKQGEEGYGNNDGCDLAVLFIAKNGTVTASCTHMPIYVCNGKEVIRLRGQHIFVGEGSISKKENIRVIHIPANPNHKFYIASDGLSDQPGGAHDRPYGYGKFQDIILANHDEAQSVILDRVWDAFEAWRGQEARVDDFELISFKV